MRSLKALAPALALALALAGLGLPSQAQVNRAPTAVAGDDVTVAESPPAPAEPTTVVLDGGRSTDPDGDELTYAWSVLSQTQGSANLAFAAGDRDGQAIVTAPMMGGGETLSWTYEVQLFVRDGRQGAAAPATDCRSGNLYFPSSMCDRLTLTVRNTNQPPTVPDGALSMVLGGEATNTLDVLADAGNTLQFVVAPVQDDTSTLSVQVVLRHPDGHEIPVSLNKSVLSAGPPEASAWLGTLRVDTPALVSDARNGRVAYGVFVQAFDRDGGRFPAGGSGLPMETLTVAVSNGAAIVAEPVLNELATARGVATHCFGSVPRLAPQALGAGQVIRPEIFFRDTSPEDRLAGRDPLLLLWKVTYQSCVSSGNFTAKGPEIELSRPYHLNLDSLFQGDQEVLVTFHDRLGRTYPYAIPIVADVGRPTFFVDAPAATYEGIPFNFTVYVQDRIDTSVSLRIDRFAQDANGTFTPHERRITSSQEEYPFDAQAFILPRLRDMVSFVDLDPPAEGFVGACELLYDGDGDGRLDAAYDHARERFIPLVADTRAQGPPDYVVDANRNGRGDAGETILEGDASTVIRQVDDLGLPVFPPCGLPFSDAVLAFLDQAPTQVFRFDMTRDLLGSTRYEVAVSDLVFNQVAQRYVFRYEGGNLTQDLQGVLVTGKVATDARVVSATPSNGPLLPGETVEFEVTVRHDNQLQPPPRIPLTLTIDDPERPWQRVTVQGGAVDSNTDTRIPVPLQSLTPGVHLLRFNVTLPDVANETDLLDNALVGVEVEVFLGKVVLGKLGSGKVWHIRADGRGQPMLQGGAVELGADGKALPGRSHDLTLREDAQGSRYEFSATDKQGNEVLLAWRPLDRYSLAYSKPCGELTAQERVINRTADPVQDPRCRPITIVEPAQATEEAPGLPILLLLTSLAALAGALRRRTRT